MQTVQCLHPSKSAPRIAREKYESVSEALLSALDEASSEGLPFLELTPAIERRLDHERFGEGSVGWYAVTVKLDLEARGIIVRGQAGGRQQIWFAERAPAAEPRRRA